jgi:LmbE family N-acetylglucosaminyl deacetylase
MFDLYSNLSEKKVLILAPHTDDGEFGCGGTISKLIENKTEVHYIAFSSCDESLPPGLPRDTLAMELRAAASSLKIPKLNVRLLNYPVRKFARYRQEILEDMVKLNREIKPDAVFLPSTYDTHQDHNTISNEGFRAFKRTTILGYELPWNNINFKIGCFILLNEKHVVEKTKAIKCYKSQESRDYSKSETVRSLLITRGTQIGSLYAEAFEVIRLVVK